MSTLFLGNGINQLAGIAPSWNELLSGVTGDKHVKAPESLSMTLGFEVFVQEYLRDHPEMNEIDIKEKICTYLEEKQKAVRGRLWTNIIHERLLNSNPCKIITTNYDYFLELAINSAFEPNKFNKSGSKEWLYSKNRYREVNGIKIYHTHGEVFYPKTICLGYEQYIGSVQYIRASLLKPSGKKKGEFHLAKVLNGEEIPENDCWYYSFFLDDLDILGFGLDVSELDIWWLLNYRARIIREFPQKIKNKITYYETDSVNHNLSTSDSLYQVAEYLQRKQIMEHKKKILEEFGVQYILCQGTSYSERYEDALMKMGL